VAATSDDPPAALVLLGSPLLGPAVWAPVAAELARRGRRVLVPTQPPEAPRDPDDVLRAIVAALPEDGDVVLVPHSNAGLFVPALSTRRRLTGYVFVDAGLPEPSGTVPLAPPGFLEYLAGRADADGVLPLWTNWWGEDVGVLFPDAGTRERVEREQRRLPLSYFQRSLPVPAGWDDRPGAYLAFGDTYAAERAEAARRGWPARTLAGEHLHMLIEPERVTGEILALLAEIGLGPEGS
jgi:hypothetical protein